MALDFGMLQPVNIAGNILAGQQETQRNQLAQQQLAMGGLQQQHTQMQLEQATRERDALAKMQQSFIANGKSGNLRKNFQDMLDSGIPHFMDIGLKGQQALDRQSQVSRILGIEPEQFNPPPSAEAPSAPSASNLPAYDNTTLSAAGDSNARRQAALEAPVTAQAPFVETRNLPAPGEALPPATPVPAANQLAPTSYKPVMPTRNALAAPVSTAANEIENTYRKIDQLHAIGEHELAKSLEQRVKDKLPPTMVQEYKFAQTPEGGGFKGSFEQFKVLQAPKTTVNVPVNVSTERKYSEQFANKMADTDIAKMTTAEKAPELAANADRVLDILKQGNVFTGSAADIKLNIARGLNVIGASNDEKIANTESLISGLAKNTLGAVKSSGLGSGAGFTDKDLQFLQDAEGGRITLNAQTLQRLATLSRKAAEKSAEVWNSRVTQMPKSAIEGTGLSTQPISVPKRVEAPPAIYATNPKTGERIQSTDGGNTWKPAGAK